MSVSNLLCFNPLYWILIGLPFYVNGQLTPIDSLAQLPTTTPVKERVALWKRIDVFIRAIKKEEEKKLVAQQYLQIAKERKGSLFLATDYF